MTLPAPEIDQVNHWYWEGLAEGELRFQHCRDCGLAWLPPTEECSRCLSSSWELRRSSGSARLISWVRYHVAPHPGFKDRLPYNVAVVELAEGPRTVTNLVGVQDWSALAAGMQLELEIEQDDGVFLARFRVAGTEQRHG